ncbi:hypothetical protein [Conexibacter sp. W3-3-2]|uniref:hypothetical protein n=1 Tax=Conexibacter sp. W3-3-2 TaxID=2675227 RepID=UPI0018AA1398|nr:hypothetical protein [Conexibacter sp. W3-3-2]
MPHELRSSKAGKADAAAQEKAWKPLDALLAHCGFDLADELAPFRPRSDWPRMSAAEHAAARSGLMAAWARHATDEYAARLRAWMIGGLVDRFYAKAKTATPTSRQALTKAYWRPMAGLFGGDWLAFLEYLGEQPNPSEEIVGSLPEPKLYATGADRARQAAADAGIDEAEIERMLASFFGSHDASSPVDRRIAVLKRAWAALDGLHASLTPARGTLWGVLDERNEIHDERFDECRTALHREVLPADLNDDIAALWGTQATSKDPGRLVTRWLPHNGVYDAFGVALQFWHEIALTAFAHTETHGFWEWGLSEAQERQQSRLDELAAARCPVDASFLRELATAARDLPPIAHEQHRSRAERDGFAIELTFSGRDRLPRPGFEQLRDVITRHRRAWAEQHLDRWLEHRWQTDLRATAEAYNRRLIANGKAPTLRQAITLGQPALDRWFGGDIGQLLTAIGQKGPAGAPVYERRLPGDPYSFGRAVEIALGGRQPEDDLSDWDSADRERLDAHRKVRDHNSARYYAAFTAYEYVKAWEALGRRPEMKQVKGGKSGADFLDRAEPEAAWARLEAAVLNVVDDPSLQRAGAETATRHDHATQRRTQQERPAPGISPRERELPSRPDADPRSAADPQQAEPTADAPVPKRRGLLRRMLDR